MLRMGLRNVKIHEARVNTEENTGAMQEDQHGGVKFCLTNLVFQTCFMLSFRIMVK